VFHQPSGHRVADTMGGRIRRRLKCATPAGLLALYRALRQLALREPGWEIHGIPRAEVVTLVEAHGGRVVRIEEDFNPRRGWTDCAYYVTQSSGNHRTPNQERRG